MRDSKDRQVLLSTKLEKEKKTEQKNDKMFLLFRQKIFFLKTRKQKTEPKQILHDIEKFELS